METAGGRYHRAFIAILLGLLFSLAAPAQELMPDMEPYLRTTLVPATYDINTIELTNLYNFSLVAASWSYTCDGSARRRGSGDAALVFTDAVAQGSKFPGMSAENVCTGTITAAIFADGKELGDPAVLRRMHNCRKASWEELHRTLKEDILAVPFSNWDVDSALNKLRARRAEFPTFISVDHVDPEHEDDRGCRMDTLDWLISRAKSR